MPLNISFIEHNRAATSRIRALVARLSNEDLQCRVGEDWTVAIALNRSRLKSEGFELDDVAQRVAQILGLPLEVVWGTSRRPQTVQARSLLCYWASQELGLSMTEIANRLGLTQPAVSIAARRGEEIARQEGYSLLEN